MCLATVAVVPQQATLNRGELSRGMSNMENVQFLHSVDSTLQLRPNGQGLPAMVASSFESIVGFLSVIFIIALISR
jgi:hypothetical protein